MIAVQNVVSSAEMSTAMAIMTFCHTFGGSSFLAIAPAIFSQSLQSNLPFYAPDVDAEAVIAAGATGFHRIVPTSRCIGRICVLLAHGARWDPVCIILRCWVEEFQEGEGERQGFLYR
jgi:hypothetical protein